MFSTEGNRPVVNMMAGGDLDGDCYFVCWDNDLIPEEDAIPLDYLSASPVDKQIIPEDMISPLMVDWFLRFHRTDTVGLINWYYDCLWDICEDGSKDPRCEKIAEMASRAVVK